MKLWTARFANPTLAEHPAAKVQISLGAPKFRLPYRLQQLPQLAPLGWMLGMPEARFTAAYARHLDRLGVDHVRQILENVANDAGAALLCFENVLTPGVWCHRQQFSSWWELRTGEVVEELPEA